MKNMIPFRTLAFVVGLLAVTVITPVTWARPLVSRTILKSFFQAGDQPTQSQFAVLIDSSVFQFQFTSGAGGAHIIEGIEPGTGILTDSLGIRHFGIGDTVPVSPFFSQTVNLSSFVVDDRYLIGLRFMHDGQAHYGYMNISVDSPLPGQAGFFGFTVHYLAYEDLPNTPLTVVPAPAIMSGVMAGAVLLRRRRRD